MGRRSVPKVLATAVLVATTLVGPGGEPAGAASATLKWSVDLPGAVIRESSPLAVDLDGGGGDVMVGAHDGRLYAVHGSDGSAVAGWPRQTTHGINSSPAAADVDGDGRPEVFVGSGLGTGGECSGGGFYSFRSDGTERFRLQGTDQNCPDQAFHSSPALGDVNGDGAVDATIGSLGLRMYSVSSGGAMNPGWPYYTDDTVFSSPALADVNGDGSTDVVIGGDSSPGGPLDFAGGLVRAISGNGATLWEFRVNEIVRSSPAIGDVDGDGRAEIVFGVGDYWVRRQAASDATKVFALHLDGTLKWVRDVGGYAMGGPALADVDGDGVLDVAVGTFEGPSPGRVFALRGGDGSDLPNFPITAAGGVVLGGITTADLDGDGGQDLLVPTGAGLTAYSGRTARPLLSVATGVAQQNSPLVTDVDGNGLVDIIVAGSVGSTGRISRYEMSPADGARLGDLAWPTFHRDARRTGSWTGSPLTRPVACPESAGYWLAASDGGVFAFCSAGFHGSTGAVALARPVVGLAGSPGGRGYWLVAADGGIFAFGDAVFRGSTGALRLNQPVVGMERTPSGDGYWLVASDGGIFAFGDAPFLGSTGATRLNRPIVGMARTPSGDGYWLVASDGGVFAFGDAAFVGSTGNLALNQPVVDLAPTPSGLGYRLVAADGGIFAFGDAVFRGSTGALRLNQPVVGMSPVPGGDGYWLVASDGGIFAFDAPFLGSTGAIRLNRPIVGMATPGG